MGKQNVAYACDGPVHKKEGNFNTCYSMNESWEHYAEWNKPVPKGQILYGFTYMNYLGWSIAKFIDKKQNSGCQGLEWEGMES